MALVLAQAKHGQQQHQHLYEQAMQEKDKRLTSQVRACAALPRSGRACVHLRDVVRVRARQAKRGRTMPLPLDRLCPPAGIAPPKNLKP